MTICQKFNVTENWLGNDHADEIESFHHAGNEGLIGFEHEEAKQGALDLLHEIINDGDPTYRRAIMANLTAFSTAIRERQQREKVETEVAGLKADQIKTAGETEKLRQELAELRGIVQAHARASTYTGPERRLIPDRRVMAGESPDGIEHRRGLDRRVKETHDGETA